MEEKMWARGEMGRKKHHRNKFLITTLLATHKPVIKIQNEI